MVHGGDTRHKDTTDIFDILETERCLSKLSVGYLAVNHLIHHLRYGLVGYICKRPRARFYRVCHHQDSPFLGGRFGTGVLEVGRINLHTVIHRRIVEIAR